ncbi:hypothetical protein EDB80DRAFT_701097 [Ilyonectria destructans]|nr:hypothetical protein EDB80DRAFT_701097 [Ilyonectria destructans]
MCDTRPLPRPGRMRIYEFDRAGTSWNMPSTTPLIALQHSAACALRFDVGRTRRGWTLGHMTASLWISVGGAVVSARYWFLGRRVGGLGDRVSRYRHWKRGFSPHRCFSHHDRLAPALLGLPDGKKRIMTVLCSPSSPWVHRPGWTVPRREVATC